MSSFNPATGALTISQAGATSNWSPPFPDPDSQIDGYINDLKKLNIVTGYLKIGTLSPDASVSSMPTQFPAVSIYNITQPPIFVIVYTDANGNSQFSYKDDPTGRIQLVHGGSQIQPTVVTGAPVIPTRAYNTAAPASSTNWTLILCLCCCLLAMIGGGYNSFRSGRNEPSEPTAKGQSQDTLYLEKDFRAMNIPPIIIGNTHKRIIKIDLFDSCAGVGTVREVTSGSGKKEGAVDGTVLGDAGDGTVLEGAVDGTMLDNLGNLLFIDEVSTPDNIFCFSSEKLNDVRISFSN